MFLIRICISVDHQCGPLLSSGLFSSRTHIFYAGRVYSPLVVLTLRVRPTPSSPGYFSVILPSFHCPRGWLSSTTKARSPTSTFLSSICHLWRTVRVGMYSLVHLRHTCSAITWACLHLFIC